MGHSVADPGSPRPAGQGATSATRAAQPSATVGWRWTELDRHRATSGHTLGTPSLWDAADVSGAE